MSLTNTCQRSALVFLIMLTACNQPGKPAQRKAPISKPADTTIKTDSATTADTTLPPDTARKKNTTAAADTTKKGNASATGNSQGTSSGQALTLPILDALFYDPGFAKELKGKLGLPARKIAELKTAAHASVTELSEGGSADTASAREATNRYNRRIKALIGAKKAQQLLQLVNQRYSQGVEGLAPTRPNFVPSDTRIVVNAPAFRMDVFEKGKLIKSYKVSIGYPEFPLPAGMRRADTVIFHPSWIPPDDPWVKGKFAPGRKVSAASELNPLGVVKIPIGMPALIHGGKPLDKIGNLGSHGCVGLTNEQVLDLVPTVLRLGESDLSPESLRSLEKQKKTRAVKLPTPVPVDLRYETIVAENGGLHIYRDVYERGTNTTENAKAVLAAYGIRYEQLNVQEQNDLEAALAEMNRDARGRPIAAADSAEPSKPAVPADTRARARKGRVTSKIKGKTDVLVPLAELQGKGYPAPVALDEGQGKGRVRHKHLYKHHRRRRHR